MESTVAKKRIWELDFFRGVALIFMIYYHLVYDLKFIYDYPISLSYNINYYIGKISVILFMLITGISCTLSNNNTKRAIKILIVAGLITVFTHGVDIFFDLDLGIKFGILHFLGISILFYSFLKKLDKASLILLGTLLIIVGRFTSRIIVSHDWFFFLGMKTDSFISSDYYPLIPWLGVFIYGIVLGKLLYKQKRSIFKFSLPNNLISSMGQKTFLIYILHQPIILIALWLIHLIIQ